MTDNPIQQIYIHPHVAWARQEYDDRFGSRHFESVQQMLQELAEDVYRLSQSNHPLVRVLIKSWLPQGTRRDIDPEQPLSIDLEEARLAVAREHGFRNWDDVVDNGPTAIDIEFEAAVDAVTTGNVAALRSLLAAAPRLRHQRSTFGHRAALIHYVAANGVETRRQLAPSNVRQIIEVLVAYGAQPDETCGLYGGGPSSTPLCLAISSQHPTAAETLGDIVAALSEAGAKIDGIDRDGLPLATAVVTGNSAALPLLAKRNARVDHPLMAAACGKLDAVKDYVFGKHEVTATQSTLPAEFRMVDDGIQSCLEITRRVAVRFNQQPIVDFVDEVRNTSSNILDQFDEAIESDIELDWEAFIPPNWSGAIRRQLLAELCAIHMEYCWLRLPSTSRSIEEESDNKRAMARDPANGSSTNAYRIPLHQYLSKYPELGPWNSIPLQLLAESFRIRNEAGDSISVDEFVSEFPSRSESLRPLLEEIQAEQDHLRSGLTLSVYIHQQMVYSQRIDRPVVLGRQRHDDPEAFCRIEGDQQDRVVIASYRDRYVSREHIGLEPSLNGRVRVTNLSKKNAFTIDSYAEFLLPGQSQEYNLPIGINIESRTLIVQRVQVDSEHDTVSR